MNRWLNGNLKGDSFFSHPIIMVSWSEKSLLCFLAKKPPECHTLGLSPSTQQDLSAVIIPPQVIKTSLNLSI